VPISLKTQGREGIPSLRTGIASQMANGQRANN
jgi:hypothetical protein